MNKKANALYFSSQGLYWFLLAPVVNFLSAYLLPMGFKNAELGAIIASGNVIALILQPFLSDFADRSKRVTLPTITIFVTLGLFILVLISYSIPQRGLFLMMTYVLMLAVHTAIIPLINSLNFYLAKRGFSMNYGIGRSGGSVFFALCCLVLGKLVLDYGTGTIAWCAILGCIVFLVVLWGIRQVSIKGPGFFQDDGENHSGQRENPRLPEEDINLLGFITKNKLFFVLNLSFFMIFFSQQTINSFLLQIITPLGGNSQDMGNIFSFMSFLEVPALFAYNWLDQKFGTVTLMKFAGFSFVIRMIIILFATSPTAVLVSMIFHAPGFSILYPAMVTYINKLMNPQEAVKGQALFTMMLTLGSITCSLVGGFVLDYLAASALVCIAIVVSSLGIVLLWIIIPKIPLPERGKDCTHE